MRIDSVAEAPDQRFEPLLGVAALTLSEARGRPVENGLLQLGLPLPRGACFNPHNLLLLDDAQRPLGGDWQAMAFWPDNSIKWALLRGNVTFAERDTPRFHVACRRVNPRPGMRRPRCVTEHPDHLLIHTAQHVLRLSTRQWRLFDVLERHDDTQAPGAVCMHGDVLLGANADPALPGQIDSVGHATHYVDDVPSSTTVDIAGRYPLSAGELRFTCRLQVNLQTGEVAGRLTLHNPAAASHPSGLWDLGDAEAIQLRRLALRLESADWRRSRLRITPASPWQALPVGPLSLLQGNSGGDNKASPVHCNREGHVLPDGPGYTLRAGDALPTEGARAQPVLQRRGDALCLSVSIDDFWQRFPSGLGSEDQALLLELFPANTPEPAELQPGERFTRGFRLRVETQAANDPFTDLCARLEPAYVAACGLAELGAPETIDARLLTLAARGLDASGGFLHKREHIDEYGWRNFGELYADHENDLNPGSPLVSHYNNQYDPLFGFLRQYLLAGEQAWWPLAMDLASHLIDIDIYHTDRDRPEYNHGLFWHTDHYLDAATATHRSYSRQQPSNAYEGHAGGGGPGGQHCYTTGLLYAYVLTGDVRYHAALTGLKDWISGVYEGSGTLVDALLAIKQRHRRDLKNHLTGRYPLDRGTANYLQALLDSYYLDRSPATLNRVEQVIQHTVHPADDLAARTLDNVEDHWFYTVFLQALCRYLQVKEELTAWDTAFYHARDSLLHYADWMEVNEAPYLQRPDILEFPNHTWTAQDLRKAAILFSAARYDAQRHAAFVAKAEALVTHVADTLAKEPTVQYTRILALIMQNLTPSTAQPPLDGPAAAPRRQWSPPAEPGALAQVANWLRLAGRALWHLQPKEEWQALRTRFAPKRGQVPDQVQNLTPEGAKANP